MKTWLLLACGVTGGLCFSNHAPAWESPTAGLAGRRVAQQVAPRPVLQAARLRVTPSPVGPGGVSDSDDDFDVDAVEETGNQVPAQPVRPLGPAAAQFQQIVFGGYAGDVYAAASHQMEFLLQTRLTTTDQICQLTPAQKHKLQLAGRGDIKRLVEEMRETRERCEEHDRGGAGAVPEELFAVARSFRNRLENGPFGPTSVLARTLPQILTAEQSAQNESYLALERLGGRMHLRPHGDGEIKALRMTKGTLTDEGLAPVATIAGLKSLNLDYTQVSDAGLVHLKSLKTLEILEMEGTRIAGPGLAALRDLQMLETLDLRRCKLNDQGLSSLPRLEALKVLQLSHTQVAGPGVPGIEKLPHLEVLMLVQTPVEDAALPNLAGFPRLRELNLEGTAVSDAGLPHLARLASLETLDLRRTRVTDAGLAHLKDLRALRAVYLFGTQVTPAGAMALEREMPGTRVVR